MIRPPFVLYLFSILMATPWMVVQEFNPRMRKVVV
jgi:hypothetical protein